METGRGRKEERGSGGLYNYVGREHPADEGVVQAAVHVDEPEVVVVLVHGAAKLFSGCKVTKIYFFIAIYFTQ